MAERSQSEIISNMANVGDSGQDGFVEDWAEFAKELLRSRGISEKYINSTSSAYILAKIVTDMIENGELSRVAEIFISSVRINHPKSEDAEGGGANV